MDNIILVQEQPINQWELVEVPVIVNGVGRVAIPDQPMLKSWDEHMVVIKAIEIITAKTLSHAPIGGQVAATRAELIKCSLVLYSDGWEMEHFLPLQRLICVHDADATTATTNPFMNNPTRFEDLKKVDWTKSYVQYSNGQVSANVPYAFLFGVQYLVFDSTGKRIKP